MSLTRKQIEVIADLFEEGGDESAVLSKHKIKPALWLKWHTSKDFNDEILRRIASYQRQGEILLAKYRPAAIVRLIGLCNSDNPESSRKACADMLNFVSNNQKPGDTVPDETLPKIDEETASELLAVLAERTKTNPDAFIDED